MSDEEQTEEFVKKQKIVIEHKGLGKPESEVIKELETKLEEKEATLQALALAEFEKQKQEVASELGISEDLINDTNDLERYKAKAEALREHQPPYQAPSGFATRQPMRQKGVEFDSPKELIDFLTEKAEKGTLEEKKIAHEKLDQLFASAMSNPNFKISEVVRQGVLNTYICPKCGKITKQRVCSCGQTLER